MDVLVVLFFQSLPEVLSLPGNKYFTETGCTKERQKGGRGEGRGGGRGGGEERREGREEKEAVL